MGAYLGGQMPQQRFPSETVSSWRRVCTELGYEAAMKQTLTARPLSLKKEGCCLSREEPHDRKLLR